MAARNVRDYTIKTAKCSYKLSITVPGLKTYVTYGESVYQCWYGAQAAYASAPLFDYLPLVGEAFVRAAARVRTHNKYSEAAAGCTLTLERV